MNTPWEHDNTPYFSYTHSSYKAPSTPKQTFHDLKKGKIPVSTRINLRGMTVPEAQKATEDAIIHNQKQSLFLLIHGKGLRSDSQPVLKKMLQNMLYQHPRVIAYCPATLKDGGDGAMYLLWT